jgi:hypothetical protein
MVLTAEGTGQAELGSFFYIGRNVMGPRRLGTRGSQETASVVFRAFPCKAVPGFRRSLIVEIELLSTLLSGGPP